MFADTLTSGMGKVGFFVIVNNDGNFIKRFTTTICGFESRIKNKDFLELVNLNDNRFFF